MKKVVKRDGRVTEFDQSRIKSAVCRAYAAVRKGNPETLMTLVAVDVTREASKAEGDITVEQVQKLVEDSLMKRDPAVARAYIEYRHDRDVAREEREDHHPQLADLRDSGSIEQDADVVMMIYREEVYRPEANNHGKAEILLRKVRQGEIGTVPCTFSGEFQKFEEDASTPADKTKAYNAAQDKKFARQESKVKY